MTRTASKKWPPGAAVAMYGSCVLEVYEPYQHGYLGNQARVRSVDGTWPGLVAVGVGLLHPVTPMARKLLRLAASATTVYL